MRQIIEEIVVAEINNNVCRLHELTEILEVHTTEQIKSVIEFADLYRKLLAQGVITEGTKGN